MNGDVTKCYEKIRLSVAAGGGLKGDVTKCHDKTGKFVAAWGGLHWDGTDNGDEH